MRSFDTNVLVRALRDDDAVQSPLARELLSGGGIVVSTVLLETIWVLSARDHWTRQQCVDGLRSLMLLEGLDFIDAPAVAWAIDRYEAGGDFADMLHVALSGTAASFVTFDRDVARRAANASITIETF